MEAAIVQSLCRSAEVRRLRINGVKMPLSKICDRVAPYIELMHSSVDVFHVVVDREGRAQSAKSMREAIINDLAGRGSPMERVSVHVPDRCLENWFAPFLDNDLVIQAECMREVEGINGKSVIKRLFKAKGRTYNEQIDGPKLFKAVNPGCLKDRSKSFEYFFSSIDDDCWWKSGKRVSTSA